MILRIDNIEEELDFSGTLEELVKGRGFLLEEVIVRVNGAPAPETKRIRASDKVEILKVVFGG